MRGRSLVRRVRQRDLWVIPLLLLGGSAISACGNGEPAADTSLRAAVSILPQRDFVERIGGEHVNLTVMVPPGASPAVYEPTAQQMRELSRSDLYFSVDVPFERAWIERFRGANPKMRIIDTTTGVERRTYPNDVVDPHIWLSPRRAMIQAQTIASALIAADPAHQHDYAANLEALLTEIGALDTRIRGALGPYIGSTIMQFHPAWDYFAEDYGLVAVSVEVGGQEPSASQLADLIRTAEREGIRAILVQPQFSTRDAETIAAQVGAEIVVLDPLAEDWLVNLERVTGALVRVLSAS
jgi:zinc transport system substrate-binding protein